MGYLGKPFFAENALNPNIRHLNIYEPYRVFHSSQHTRFSKDRASYVALNFPPDLAFLHGFGIGYPILKAAVKRALANGVLPAQALIMSGGMTEVDYYRCAASELGLDFAEDTPATGEAFEEIPSRSEFDKTSKFVTVDGTNKVFHLVPDMANVHELKNLLERWPFVRSKIRVTTPTSNRDAVESYASVCLLRTAVSKLSSNMPSFSAKVVLTNRQVVFVLVTMAFVAGFLMYSGSGAMIAFHLMATLFYLGCISVRFYAAIKVNNTGTDPSWVPPPDRLSACHLPVYTVLVALYNEAGQARGLITALDKLEWPREKLEIKLVCEADDHSTIQAIENILAEKKIAHMRVVRVPVQEPRTKPKALNYALPFCRGKYVVIYDAEDRPDPLQLMEAHDCFANADGSVVCVQAPLVIHNGAESWLSGLFAIEYSALFDGLLPALANKKLPFPLGGTSNHFKRAALEEVGAWDPYNVTEDADLGMRFARLGYDIGTITRPTYEEAPVKFDVWKKQRTRWFKGWLQTWLVHMRHPIRLWRDLGSRGSIAFHVMITGMIMSALVHPFLLFFLAAAIWQSWNFGASALFSQPLFWLDAATILFGYLAFSMLAWRTLKKRKMTRLRRLLWTVPAYWMLLSVAAWRAVWHLIWQPHKWEKTPHRLVDDAPIQVKESVSTTSGPVPDSWN